MAQQHQLPPPPYSHHLLTKLTVNNTPSSSSSSSSSSTSISNSNSPRLASIHTLHPSPSPTQLPSPPAPCPPYLFDLAQANRPPRPGFISREPSLPSIMSMPSTRPVSPDHLPNSPRTTFASNHLSNSNSLISPTTSSNPTSPHLSRRFFTRSSARALSSLCMFEDGLQHYERLRSPSLRGHSRRTSLIHSSLPDNQIMLKDQLMSNEMFQLDLSDDFSEQTFRQPHWSDDDEAEEEEEDDEDDEDQDYDDPFRRDREPGSRGTRKLFKVGDRVGVGTIHQGYRVRDIFAAAPASNPRLSQSSIENYGASGILEIVRQIGVGSYAVVYLVREVLYDPDLESEASVLDSALSQTPKASDGFASLSAFEKAVSTRKRASSQVVYGKDFALKCLCKRNLSDQLLVLQRGEAELHRSLPLHHNIVALHRQARDSQDLESMSSRTTSYTPNFPGSVDTPLSSVKEHTGDDSLADLSALSLNTPPSPSLLASTADDEMLSRRRLRLISKMFVQMCDAVEACHQAGVCHRDIKPENFIVVDDRKGCSGDNWKAQPTETQVGPRSSVIVKITDWGLGTSSKACEDFDCGSKPYMAYECRNNLNPTYDPVQADVWSLGIVLLNLLYHRCPWADPSGADPDFSEFRRGPVRFLRSRFEGMTESVAAFLAENIFCEVGLNNQRRISAGKFGEWAKYLLQHMGGGHSHASVSNATIALSPSSARGGGDLRRSIQRTSLGRISKVSSQVFHSNNSPHPEALTSSTLPEALTSSTKLPEAAKEDFSKPPPLLTSINLPISDPQGLRHSIRSPESILDTWPINTLDVKLASEPTEILADEVLSVGGPIGTTKAAGEDSESMTSASKLGYDKSKRRKRGARKGRRTEGKQNGSAEPETPSPTSEKAGVDMLDGLAEASQSLAREISQATRTMKPSDEVTTTKRKMNIAERMMEKFRDGSNPDLQAFVARAKAREAAYMGKVKSNTASAPAQLQEINKTTGQNNVFLNSTAFSSSSFGVGSTISSHSSSNSTSWGNSSESSCSFSKPSSMTHWSSASNRRERIQKTINPLPTPTPPPPIVIGGSYMNNNSTTTLASRKDNGSGAALVQSKPNPVNHPNKKEESKNKLAQLLTSFKRYNSTVGNHLSSSTSNHLPSTTSVSSASSSIPPFKLDNP